MPDQVVPLRSQPGIKRDGTRFEGDFYVDGQWVRFQRGLPRKIGGYTAINHYANGIVRQFHTQALNNNIYTHMGTGYGVQRMTIDTLGTTGGPIDRTPATYTQNDDNTWQFDALYDAAGSSTVLLAHATPSVMDISTSVDMPVYIGDIYSTSVLTPLLDTATVPFAPITASGGIVVLHPYLFVFDANGRVRWSDVNDPNNFTTGDAGDAFPTSSKIIKGLPLRGGGQSPAGILWTLDSLIRVTYTGGSNVFSFDTVTASTSVLAVNSIIEYDGIYFWVGMDRFLMYNGVVREVENNLNINDFFDNLNSEYANKIFAYKVPRFGEIWWCYPRGSATECSHAVIYNVRENTWYDTELPNGGRSAGIYAQVFHSPIMAGVDPILPPAAATRITEASDTRVTDAAGIDVRITDTGYNNYRIWRHEYGVDEVDGPLVTAVQSYFETGDISFTIAQNPVNRGMVIKAIEPDFVQTGDMTVQIHGRVNARSEEVNGPILTFPPAPAAPADQIMFFKEQRRELRVRFESNVAGGDYQMGQILMHIDTGDGRMRS